MATVSAAEDDRSSAQPPSSTGAVSIPRGDDSFLCRIRRDPQKRATLCNDGVLLSSLLYSTVDILLQWPELEACQKPVGSWLVGSYAMVSAYRISSYISQPSTAEGEEDRALHLRQPNLIPKVVAYLTWTLLLPFFCYWTLMGSWKVVPLLWQGQQACLPDGAPLWFVAFCQLLCYFWALLYSAYLIGILRFEYRLYRAEQALRAIESPETLRRWGRMSVLNPEEQAVGLTSGSMPLADGLDAIEIKNLPEKKICAGSNLLSCSEECAICLTGFHKGDTSRELPTCGHNFHKECIDLWLLRSATCPLCKCNVATSGSAI